MEAEKRGSEDLGECETQQATENRILQAGLDKACCAQERSGSKQVCLEVDGEEGLVKLEQAAKSAGMCHYA